AQETNSVQPEKSGYNLFSPTPDHLMREMSPVAPVAADWPRCRNAGKSGQNVFSKVESTQ
ncbi:MAG TPA: hypothetical protein VGI63_03550, partial [Verrucomicrobiae bacterium]